MNSLAPGHGMSDVLHVTVGVLISLDALASHNYLSRRINSHTTNTEYFIVQPERPSVGLYIHGGTCPILQASRHQWQAGRPTQHSTGTFLAVVCELYCTAFSSTFGTLTDFYSGIISSALSTEPVKCANLALENNFLFSLNYPLLSCGALRVIYFLTQIQNLILSPPSTCSSAADPIIASSFCKMLENQSTDDCFHASGYLVQYHTNGEMVIEFRSISTKSSWQTYIAPVSTWSRYPRAAINTNNLKSLMQKQQLH
ncbi:unnamed protein product [Nesidiocoris tenuis]|uniref:Uncharacterized protein n=1 Tax=Nesidiocoris tenuis TaxID=355587 RepID=A0A6H5FWM9_9HEMI|nr:unnamed protein product [Nesidiocoris tenuis]